MSSCTNLQSIIGTYMPQGLLKGGELLLPPALMLSFIDDLAAIGGLILGLDGWIDLDGSGQCVKQDMDVDFFVGDDLLQAQNAVQVCAAATKHYLRAQLAAHTQWVSVTYELKENACS